MRKKEVSAANAACWWFRTLHKRWLHSYIFSPSGRDKSEGAGGGNPFFHSLLGSTAHQCSSDHRILIAFPRYRDCAGLPGGALRSLRD